MAKLGKKARKFARKNLQSVLKTKRKHKAVMFKRKFPSRAPAGPLENGTAAAEKSRKENLEQDITENSEGIIVTGATSQDHFDNVFSEEDVGPIEDVSDSDGSLSEDPECPYVSQSEDDDIYGGNDHADVSQNNDIFKEIVEQKKKLDRLQKKDPKFSEFLESKRDELEKLKFEDIYSDEENDTSYPDRDAGVESLNSHDKVLTSYNIDVWSWLVTEQPNDAALRNLLNGFRAASQYAIDRDDDSSHIIPNKQIFSKIVTFVLLEADCIFRKLLAISESCGKESILKLTNKSEWQCVRPLLKSYLRSCLNMLNQITDSKILVFILSCLGASTVFFAAFPSLARRFIKISVHLWATGDKSLSLSSFFILRDIALKLDSEYLDECLRRMYQAFIACCKFVEPANLKHVEHLRDSVIELYSLDIQTSYPKVIGSVQQLANVLRQAHRTKKKEDLKKIYNWQFISCLNLWVKFITCNVKDNNLQPLPFLIIEVLRGIIHLFPSPRYLPLRFKCVQMINELSLSSGIFIPVASLVLECLEYQGSNSNTRRSSFDFASVLKVEKQLLKSQYFQEESILYAIELLVTHFAQWSYHISFPELATIPLILLKRFHDTTTIERLRRPVKRLMDQVEQNCKFIERKRNDVTFSPNDHESVNTFLQLEKGSSSEPFTQYYASILQSSNTKATTTTD